MLQRRREYGAYVILLLLLKLVLENCQTKTKHGVSGLALDFCCPYGLLEAMWGQDITQEPLQFNIQRSHLQLVGREEPPNFSRDYFFQVAKNEKNHMRSWSQSSISSQTKLLSLHVHPYLKMGLNFADQV